APGHMRGYRVWAEIDLAALRHNIATVRRALEPRTRILAVAKADAYGHGALPVAWTALDAGCTMIGVGDSGEAVQLREGGITGPILILGAVVEEEIHKVVQYDISVTVHSSDLLPLLNQEAYRRNRRLRVHLKVDTGMSRLGASPMRTLDVARAVLACPNLVLEGVSTHLASAFNADAVREQLDQFRSTVDELAVDGIQPPILHAANSAGLFTCPESHFDMVRPGIALYGIDPGIFGRLGISLKPVLSLKTQIAYLKGVAADVAIGYEGRYRTPRPTRIATCPVGYNDGYPYQLSGRGEAVLRGRRVPVVGSVTMDYIMLDVGDAPDAQVGDEVTLIGGGIRVEDLARKAGTIPYELTCRLGRRVGRVPANAEQPLPSAFRVVA
ncbi:MAG TPA: alanine racemase, partial [Planctomycetota bacterium]|nr:alanine racemase [Planctomycetota bacterium]